MTDQEHTPTEQETAIYDALTAGDHETIDDLRDTAYNADQIAPEDAGEDWRSPAEQYDEDYRHAYGHYQSDHEAPERDRVEHTADVVQDENLEADDG